MRKNVACNCKEERNGTRESYKIIPDGWSECSYRRLFKVASGEGLTQKKMIDGAIPVFGGNGISGYHNSANNGNTNIIIGRVGANCGSVIFYSGKCWITDNALYIKEKYGEYNDLFMFYKLTHEQLNRLADRNAQPLISGEKIYELKALIPKKIEEQESIAKILSTWDKAIELKEKLIEEKKKQKSGLMQKLLTGKVRLSGFDGEWTESTLKKCIIEYTEKSTISNQYPVLTSARSGLMLQSDYYSNRQVTTDDNVGYNIIPRDYITFRSRSDDGKFVFNKNSIIDMGIVSYFYPVFKFSENVDGDFMLELLNYSIERQSSSFVEGTAQKVLSLKKLSSFKYLLPPKREQEAISKLIVLANSEIILLEKELEALKQQKKGLMQLLLTGIVRVSVETN